MFTSHGMTVFRLGVDWGLDLSDDLQRSAAIAQMDDADYCFLKLYSPYVAFIIMDWYGSDILCGDGGFEGYDGGPKNRMAWLRRTWGQHISKLDGDLVASVDEHYDHAFFEDARLRPVPLFSTVAATL